MKEVRIKVNHTRYLNNKDAEKLKDFNIKVRPHSRSYQEFTAHVTTQSLMTEKQIEDIRSNFNIQIFEEKEGCVYLTIDMNS